MRGGNAHGAARATARGRARAMMYAGTGAAHLAAAAQDRAEAGEPPAGQACTRSDARWDRWGQPLRAGARRRAAPGRGPREAAAQAEASRGTPCGTPLRPRPAGPRAPRLRSADLLHSQPRLGQSAPRAPYLRTTSGHRSLLALPARSDHSPRESKLREKQKQEKRTSRTGPRARARTAHKAARWLPTRTARSTCRGAQRRTRSRRPSAQRLNNTIPMWSARRPAWPSARQPRPSSRRRTLRTTWVRRPVRLRVPGGVRGVAWVGALRPQAPWTVRRGVTAGTSRVCPRLAPSAGARRCPEKKRVRPRQHARRALAGGPGLSHGWCTAAIPAMDTSASGACACCVGHASRVPRSRVRARTHSACISSKCCMHRRAASTACLPAPEPKNVAPGRACSECFLTHRRVRMHPGAWAPRPPRAHTRTHAHTLSKTSTRSRPARMAGSDATTSAPLADTGTRITAWRSDR